MKILGKIGLKRIFYFGVTEALVTLVICYVLAVSVNHKPVWLPSISRCGLQSPEIFLFRWGMTASGLLLALESAILYMAKKISFVTLPLGVLAGLSLTGLATVSSSESYFVHRCKLINRKTIA